MTDVAETSTHPSPNLIPQVAGGSVTGQSVVFEFLWTGHPEDQPDGDKDEEILDFQSSA